MKRLLLLLFLLLAAHFVFGQFPLEDGMSWTEVLSTTGYGSFNGGRKFGYEFYIQGDSIKDGVWYKKLYANGLSSWGSGRSEWWEEYIYYYTDTLIEYGQIGLLRMNTPDRLLFLRTDSLGSSHKYHQIINAFSTVEETVLHDFEIELGDTLGFKYKANVVLQVDSMEVADGKVVRRFWFNNQQGDPTYDYWLEDIGSIYGLFGAYTTDVNRLSNLPFGLPRITLYCFNSSNLNFPIPSNYYLRDNCLRNIGDYFDAINAPRILINEERRKEHEEEEEEAEKEAEADFLALLDTIDVKLYPNLIRRRDVGAAPRFQLEGIERFSDFNKAFKSIEFLDVQGRYYQKLTDLDWHRTRLGIELRMNTLSPGFYFLIFELANGRRVLKKLVLL